MQVNKTKKKTCIAANPVAATFRPQIPISLGQKVKSEETGGAYVTHGEGEKFL